MTDKEQQVYRIALAGMPVCLPPDMPFEVGQVTGFIYVKVRASNRDAAIKIASKWGKVMDLGAKN